MVENIERFESCAVCKRTILRGERVREYVTPAGERERVCELCPSRAEAAGWLPAERVSAEGHPAARRGRGLGLRERLARATERLRQPRPPASEAGSPGSAERARGQGSAASAAGRAKRAPRRTPEAKRRVPAKRTSARPQAPGGRPRAARRQPGAGAPRRADQAPARQPAPSRPQRKPRPVPETPERRMRRAVERFNRSEHARIVAGLVRSLGQPRAAVRNLTGRPHRVAITVAWELSWYRWEVGLNGEPPAIREVDKGKELAELDERERHWNATVDRDGRVRLELAAARRSGARSE